MVTKKEKEVPVHLVRELLSYNLETGKLVWKLRNPPCGSFNGRYAGSEAFTCIEKKGYRNGRINGVNMKAHRIAWAIHYGEWPDDQIDHINGNPSDNRINNLRQVGNMENCHNKSIPSNNTSGYIGVTWHKRMNMWQAKYRIECKDVHVGYFNNPKEASVALSNSMQSAGFHKNHGRVK
jgi:hypothetical protein